MPLTYTGESHDSLNSTSYKTTGSSGEIVIVEASHEAIQDYGKDTVQARASHKYDAGHVSNNKVIIRTTDFS